MPPKCTYYYCLWFPGITQFVVEEGLRFVKLKHWLTERGFLHFVQMNTKYLFDIYRYYQYTKVYHINIYTCVVSLQSRRNALNEHFVTISCTVHVFNVLVGNVIK